MADDTVKVARHLAIAHIIVGFAMLGFGIADRVVVGDIGVSFYDFGIWIGVWVSNVYCRSAIEHRDHCTALKLLHALACFEKKTRGCIEGNKGKSSAFKSHNCNVGLRLSAPKT